MNYKFHPFFFYCCGGFFNSFEILLQFSHSQPILKPLYGNKFCISKHASHLTCKESAQIKNFLFLKINPLLYETNTYGHKCALRPFTVSCQLLKYPSGCFCWVGLNRFGLPAHLTNLQLLKVLQVKAYPHYNRRCTCSWLLCIYSQYLTKTFIFTRLNSYEVTWNLSPPQGTRKAWVKNVQTQKPKSCGMSSISTQKSSHICFSFWSHNSPVHLISFTILQLVYVEL
jgi:hypothetical protein